MLPRRGRGLAGITKKRHASCDIRTSNFGLKCYVAEIVSSAHSTHDFHPRFVCLSRLLKYLGGHLKTLKLFKLQHNVDLKRLASAVQLRPWPPRFQSLAKLPWNSDLQFHTVRVSEMDRCSLRLPRQEVANSNPHPTKTRRVGRSSSVFRKSYFCGTT